MKTMTIIVDTRERDTPDARRRWLSFGVPYERQKLNFGDYSAKIMINGEWIYYDRYIVIERKMSLDELVMCYTTERKRFEREFERAKEAGAKVYIVCENGSWEGAYGGRYRSRMTPQALTASLHAWAARYDVTIYFCSPDTTGKLIRDILYREIKEDLSSGCFQDDEQ